MKHFGTACDGSGSLPGTSGRRQGVVTVMVLVVLLLMAGLLAQFVRRAITDHRQTRKESWRHQTVELVHAGIARSRSAVTADDGYRGEIWEIEAGTIHQTNTGRVTISIEGDQVTVVARYPFNQQYPVQITRTAGLSP